MIKYRNIIVYDLVWNTIKELRKWFSEKNTNDCNVSMGIAIFAVTDGWLISYLDTKIIAKVAMARMKLN